MALRTIFLIAWRSIWRNTRRTVLSLLAVAFAASVLVFFVALQYSSYDASINATTALLSGHIQVQRLGYLDKPQLRSTITNADTLQAELAALPGVKAASLRAMAFGLVSSEQRSFGAQLIGVSPAAEQLVSSIPGVVRSGRYLAASDSPEAVIGSLLAHNLKVQPGDELTFLAQARDGSLAAAVVEVVGVFRSGSNEIDRSTIQLPLGFFRENFAMPDQAHAAVLRLEAINSLDPSVERIESLLSERYPNNTALSWDELVPGLKQAIELDVSSGWLFYLSLVLVVTFTILNTFLMSVLERTKEFGVMLALGTKPEWISTMILLECSMLTIIGILFGMLLGTLVVQYFGVFGFSVPGSEEIMAQWNLPAVIYPRIDIRSLTRGPFVILAAGIAAAIYPALRILKVVPAETMRRA